MRPFQIDVALVPEFIDGDPEQRKRAVYVVVDVIRATTTLTVAFEAGCRRVLLAPDVETALERARQEPGRFLLGGEREGVAPPGFDLGNSPAEFARTHLTDRDLLFVTTNGTRAMRACVGGFAVYAASYRNAEPTMHAAIRKALIARSPDFAWPNDHDSADIVVVCAGRGGSPAYDDALCAGYLARKIVNRLARMGFEAQMGESARIAAELSDAVMASATPLRERLVETDAGRAITRMGLADDLEWCATIDQSTAVPYGAGVEDGLVVLEDYYYRRHTAE
jgi:2-phosphosulfolactate phosphatase